VNVVERNEYYFLIRLRRIDNPRFVARALLCHQPAQFERSCLVSFQLRLNICQDRKHVVLDTD
jgi:uncharacterized protein YbjT (DUF2867 family)